MGSLLRSPKHEDEEHQGTVDVDDDDIVDMDGLDGFLGIENYDVDEEASDGRFIGCWDWMEWEEQSSNVNVVVKNENDSNVGFWEERLCLNLNLNYQQVMDAWSHRNAYYMGEVPVMEEERSNRREASVVRYKEKRQSRLFSKKIRYQVRKLNADNRPRLKGRFVKRGGSEIR